MYYIFTIIKSPPEPAMMPPATLQSLPPELFEHIILLAIATHGAPHAIACVSSTWADIALPLLHAKIHLTSPRQLHLFSAAPALRAAPGGRVVEVRLPGGTEPDGLWALIYRVLERCARDVKVLKLCLNSHMNDPAGHMIHEALELVNPEVFVWIGPDPDHHFSTAIVPPAAWELCSAIAAWSALTHLELANISFLNGGNELTDALSNTGAAPRTIVLRQAVFMHPSAVLSLVRAVPTLEELLLVDVYVHSIWGPRLRTNDLEALVEDGDRVSMERVREVVQCVAKTERLIGGDRETL